MLHSLDAQAHLSPAKGIEEVIASGAVLAMTLTIEDTAQAVERCDPLLLPPLF